MAKPTIARTAGDEYSIVRDTNPHRDIGWRLETKSGWGCTAAGGHCLPLCADHFVGDGQSLMPHPMNARDPANIDSEGPAEKFDRPRVLVVAGDNSLRTTCVEMLSCAGLEVSEAEDGEQAWTTLLSARFDLVITDYIVPKVSGRALVRRMRVAGMTQPAILISGVPDSENQSRDPWQRVDAFVAPPFTCETLLTNVEAVFHPTPQMVTTPASLEPADARFELTFQSKPTR